MEPLYYKCCISTSSNGVYTIPKNYKQIFADNIKINGKTSPETKTLIADIEDILTTGVTRENYIRFFHTLLWYDETIIRINLKRYNKSGINLKKGDACYLLKVPGLAEKRPSLIIGDHIFLIPQKAQHVIFEAVINNISETVVSIHGINKEFKKYFDNNPKFDVRFVLNRVPLERMHRAIHKVKEERQESRTFPSKSKQEKKIHPIPNFYNSLIANNPEQRTAVENIVSKSSGRAPFLVHGPPGTGKTVTVVEAILQLVRKNSNHRILVCTESNMAADHMAACLIKYRKQFTIKNFLLRACSRFRPWQTLPESVAPYCNGTSPENYTEVNIAEFMSYNIAVTTLSHASVFGQRLKSENEKKFITHLFIDEAAQASEPMSMIPVCGLLSVNGALVLAGDPQQLGPIIMSQNAKNIGLGLSLMERLQTKFPMYQDGDTRYIVMLKKNFRSNSDILLIPNALFYNNQLEAKATPDPLSKADILHEGHESRAIVFHGVYSVEQKTKSSPSYFNTKELEVVQHYVLLLIHNHKVNLEDIGVVTPYISQVTLIKTWLEEQGYDAVEVGTVEAYQGKEKRIIIISTVRANTSFLEHDFKYQLGFLVDDKRFNVALTRAKAKIIIIGNPICLSNDLKWRKYMEQCRNFGTYYGDDYE